MKKFYGWLITYNPYKKKWLAYKREDHVAYWNGHETVNPVYTNTDIDKLIEELKKTL
jgi:hypothetical protein